jgi:stage II sporulation protein D
MLRLTALAAAIFSFAVPASALADPAAPTVSATTFVVTGHGWGHGIGLSQWGAYGFAQHGWGYRQIVAHYFGGTTIGTAPPTTLRVLIASGLKTATVGSATGFTVRDGAGVLHRVSGPVTLGPTLSLPVDGNGFATQLPSPLTFDNPVAALTLGVRGYHGKLVVSSDGKRLSVIDVVGLEPYLRGVVAMRCRTPGRPQRSRRRRSSHAATRSRRASRTGRSTCTATRAARSTGVSRARRRRRTLPYGRPLARS